jgi:hypothetical protein
MYVQVKDMYICIKKGKSTRFLALKIWALAVLKFFDVVLKFELPNAWVLNFPQNSAPSLIGPVLNSSSSSLGQFLASSWI